MKIIRKNRKEDLKLLIDLGENYHGEDLTLTFTAERYGYNKYICSYINGTPENCVVDGSTVLCLLDNHRLPSGQLCVEIDIHVPDPQMPDGDFRHVTRTAATFMLGGEECRLELTNCESDYFPEELVPQAALNLLPTVIKGDPGQDADIEGCNAAIAAANGAATSANKAAAKAAAAAAAALSSASSADTAKDNANSAASLANEAAGKANTSSGKADAAAADALAAANKATAAATKAASDVSELTEKAQADVAEAVRAANEAVTAAQEACTAAADSANNAATTATAAASKADTAAGKANSAATSAEAATAKADTAAANADDAAGKATAAASEAEKAALNAVELAGRAEATIAASEKAASDAATAVATANQALTAANGATEAANTATSNATTAAQSANEAADRANKAADLVYNGPDEVVAVACYSSVEGVSTAGLVLNVYINDNTVPLTYTTDENGMVSFRVTKGLRYDIVFPDIVGCSPIGRLSYTAALQTRGIEVTYLPMETTKQEHVTIAFRRYEENATWQAGTAYADGVARVTINGVETTYHADSNGMVDFFVDLNTEYTVKIDKPADLHLTNGVYQATYTADRSARVIAIAFHAYLSDFLVVDTDGNEWTYDGFINSGKDVSEALLIHVATEELLAAGCDYYLSLHVLAYGKYHGTNTAIPGRSWAAQNVTFSSVPINPDKTSEYYYDGYKSTYLIINEGLERGIATDCHTFTSRETIQIGLDTLYGYTPTKGQYEPLVANCDYINNMVNHFRPDGNPVANFWNKNKGTSTQQSATVAYYVNRYVTSSLKSVGYFSPFPAYAKTSL